MQAETQQAAQTRPKAAAYSFWQLWNMSFGFFGIQFGWTLQIANTSAIYEYLGANPEQIPILWLAAPLTGLIVQPIIGYMSDRTWGPLGRRRPYFLVGAILASLALVLMPNASSLWMAAGALWILDTSVNISQEPFRAFVSDLLPEEQKTSGFAMQSFFIGLGAVAASLCPWLLNGVIGIESIVNLETEIPVTVKVAFYIGAAVFLAAVVWTVVTTPEYPPERYQPYGRSRNSARDSDNLLLGIWQAIRAMPETMRQLAVVQFFTWFGVFCLVIYFPPAVGHQIFGAIAESSPRYTQGVEWAGICIALYNAVTFVFSLVLPRFVRWTSRKFAHAFCLLCGGLALISLLVVRDRYLLLFQMACFGLSWASALAVPYAILSDALPEEDTGIYMGVFNAFIVIPQILASLGLGWIMETLLGNNSLLAVVFGGVSLVIAAASVSNVRDLAEEATRAGVEATENETAA